MQAIDSSRYVDAACIAYEVNASVAVAGTSQYRIQIISRDINGLNPVLHVNQLVVFTTDHKRQVLTISNASIPQNSTLQVYVQEEIVGTPCQDLSVNLITENFSSLSPLRNGHVILDNANTVYPQKDNLKFSDDFEVVDELAVTKVMLSAAVKNYLQPIGSVENSMLTEAEFQAIKGTEWVLMDGRNIATSDLGVLRGWTTLPDGRGMFLRNKNNGRVDGLQNPAGDLALGTYQADELASHDHTIQYNVVAEANTAQTARPENYAGGPNQFNTSPTGGAETRPRNITVNCFIKINNAI